MGKLSTLFVLGFLSLLSGAKINKKGRTAFHLFLSENIKKSIKHSVHGNKFVWIPEIELSASHASAKINRQELLDYKSLSHIFKKPKIVSKHPLKIKSRHLESVLVRETHSIRGKMHTDETNLHNLKCQCVFREIRPSQVNLAQESLKSVKMGANSGAETKLKKRMRRKRKNKRRSLKRKSRSKPSLKYCLLNRSLSQKTEVLCDYFYKDILSKLDDDGNRKKKKRKLNLTKRIIDKKRLRKLRKLLRKAKKRHKKHKKSNLVLLEIKN